MYAQPQPGFSEDKYAHGIRIIIARERANAQSVMETTKTISRVHHVLAKMEAEQAGVDDAVLLNTDGHLAEGTASNLFLVRDGAVLTAPRAVPQEPQPVRAAAVAAAVTPPKEHFGFNMGDDYCLANYKQFESYLKKIEGQTDRLKVVSIGKTERLERPKLRKNGLGCSRSSVS